jgi:hypothetical protein
MCYRIAVTWRFNICLRIGIMFLIAILLVVV